MKKKRRVAEKKVEVLQTNLEEKKEIAIEARKKRRIIEIIKEKKYKEYQSKLHLEEIKELDLFNNRKI